LSIKKLHPECYGWVQGIRRLGEGKSRKRVMILAAEAVRDEKLSLINFSIPRITDL
jgi:hypothetical protein